MRTTVYVDGYNLYYGLLRKSRLKWLDLYALFKEHVLDDAAELVEVRYYTAPVLGRMSDSLHWRTRRARCARWCIAWRWERTQRCLP